LIFPYRRVFTARMGVPRLKKKFLTPIRTPSGTTYLTWVSPVYTICEILFDSEEQ